MNISNKYLLPVTAILVGGVAAWLTQSTSTVTTAAYSASGAKEPVPAQVAGRQLGVHGEPAAEDEGDRIQGKVLEIIAVPNYTYLRLASSPTGNQKATADVWAAVATAEVSVGQAVTIVGAQRMDNFKSSTLNRTFEQIYFGALGGAVAGGSATRLPPGHPDIAGSASPPVQGQNPNAVNGGIAAAAHGVPSAGGELVPVGTVERATGALGHTVAELVTGRASFSGKKVRVRGVVVKSTSGVLGKTFAHIRDGSGTAKSGDHDLTVTTEQAVTVGAKLLFEGIVATDKDFGAGYTYPILLENARTVNE